MPGGMELRGFDTARFLRENWQKTPLLIRNPWTAWSNPLEPDELAGLACESMVESRLITQGDGWKLEHGPFAESRFAGLGENPWTLLVQAADHHVPAVAELLEPFRFVPNWRIDDVMVSYAVEGGGVGPHFDQYDVFLVQGLGRRCWRLGGICDDDTELLPHDHLRLLADFEPAEEWILEPGDILYVPPGVAHDGIAMSDDCMTYSIGFRAPSRGELIGQWAEHLVAELVDDDRYGDPDLEAQDNPGEITAQAIDRLHAMVAERLLDREAFARWFARYSTAPKNPEMDWCPEEPAQPGDVRDLLRSGAGLLRNPASRFSFLREERGSVLLFVDGERFVCTDEAAAFAELICAQDRAVIPRRLAASDTVTELVVDLLNQGSLAFDLED